MKERSRAHKILTAISFLSVLAAMGCGTYSPVSPSQDNSTTPGVENPNFVQILPTSAGSDRMLVGSAASNVISAEYGGIVTNGIYSIYLPPGALDEDTEITIEMPRYPMAVVELGPHGIEFNVPVILSLDISMVDSDAADYMVLWHNEDTSLWEYIGGYVEGGIIKAELEHFSEYGLLPDG